MRSVKKIKLFILPLLLFLNITLFSNEKWILIEPLNQEKPKKQYKRVDVNLSQIEPINKMMKNAAIFKQLIEATNKKEVIKTDDKNWYLIEAPKL